MLRYISKRLLYSLLVLIGVGAVVFLLVRLSGDPVLLLMPPEATNEDIERMRHLMGLDRPLAVQFVVFLRDMLQGNMGESLRYRQPALPLMLERLPATLELAGAAMAFAVVISIPLGVIAAVRRGSWIDTFASVFALIGQATPVFWLGLMGILLFSVKLRWLPSQGRGTWQQLLMPAITLGMFSAAMIMRMTRSAMLEVLSQDYVRTARAKGLSNRVVIFKHALKNAMIPVITVLGLQFGGLLGGSVVTETVFAWPGVGRLLVQSILGRDYPVVQAITIGISLVFVVINLVVDLTYGLLDPRVRYS